MNYTYQHYQIGLCLLSKVGPVRARELLRQLDCLESLFHLSPQELQKKTGVKASFFSEMNRLEALEIADRVIIHHKRNKVKTTYFEDLDYPRRLKNCIDAPLVLFSKGNFNLNETKVVSIVGTRDATRYGKQICEELIQSFKGNNITVISGLALGIDACVHRACVENNIPTYGVLGHGFDRIYPSKNLGLAEKMIENGGLLSEFIPGTMPDRENFPKRNRIVAGLSDATIVVESKLKGGSLITANLANDYNRDVFAFPGSVKEPTSQGCNMLISSQKAHLMQTPEDFLQLMNWTEKATKDKIQRNLFPDLTETQKSILGFISSGVKIQVDVLSLQTKMPISKLNSELFNLEMNGVILSLPGKRYMLV